MRQTLLKTIQDIGIWMQISMCMDDCNTKHQKNKQHPLFILSSVVCDMKLKVAKDSKS